MKWSLVIAIVIKAGRALFSAEFAHVVGRTKALVHYIRIATEDGTLTEDEAKQIVSEAKSLLDACLVVARIVWEG